MRHELLDRFLQDHPEYFEDMGDAFSLRGDLRSIFEEYAQAMDPDEYEELRRKVEDYRKKEKSRLQEEIEKLIKERKKEEERLNGILSDMENLENEVSRLETQLHELTEARNESARMQQKSWYNSGYTFLILDFLGVVFLYIGVILKERMAISYVLVGIFSIGLGFFLQQGGSQAKPATNPALDGVRQDLTRKWNEMRQIFKVRKVTLATRKKSTLAKVDEVNRKIERNLEKINEYNRE
ncbi:MAG: coiled-coil domain-containing protein [Puniceicoccaceae bacterium]